MYVRIMVSGSICSIIYTYILVSSSVPFVILSVVLQAFADPLGTVCTVAYIFLLDIISYVYKYVPICVQ